MSDVTADVVAIIAKKLPEPRELARDDRLEDLGLDSFSEVEIIFDIEEKFDIQIPYNSNDSRLEFETVGQIVDAIQKLVAGKKTQ
jgi:acyl carrier protein